MTKHNHGHKHHNKAQPKAPEPEEKPSRGLFGFLFSLIRFFLRWSLIAGVCFVLCATLALCLDCYKTGGGSIANSKGFCSDVTKLTKFTGPSERFVQNAKNAYGSVFNAYNKQFGDLTSYAQKSFNQYNKNSTFLKDAQALFYKAHKAVTHCLFYVFTLVSDAWSDVTKWYEANGKKTFGFIVEPIQVAAQMGYEIAKDLFFVLLNNISAFLVRATEFFERIISIWAQKGLSAAIDAAFKH